MSATPTATPSLRRRVTLAVLGLFAVLLVVVGLAVDLALGAQLRRDLDTRLADRVSQAMALIQAGTSPNELPEQLQGRDIRVQVVDADGAVYGDPGLDSLAATAGGPAPGGPAGRPRRGGATGRPAPPPPPDATSTVVERALPGGGRLVLVADAMQLTAVRTELRTVMLVAGAIILALSAVLLLAVVRRALVPLDRLTALAGQITGGDRGRRLRPDRSGTELGRTATAFDSMLDALEATEGRARSAAEQAGRAEVETRRFLSDAAHELRTPLAGMQAAAEQLAGGAAGDPRQQRRATLLLRETARAARLVDDMLDVARIDSGVALELAAVDLGRLLDAESDRARILAPRLEVQRTGAATVQLPADAVRVSQILSNLLDNARRHTPAGGTISIDLSATPGAAQVTVADTGPGVPEVQRERIFARLVRLENARDRDSGGAGLGLAIARGLARAHGGDLVCLPAQRGAVFRLTLPIPGSPHP